MTLFDIFYVLLTMFCDFTVLEILSFFRILGRDYAENNLNWERILENLEVDGKIDLDVGHEKSSDATLKIFLKIGFNIVSIHILPTSKGAK